MKLRVLVLTADYPPRTWSGIGTAVATQAAALARSGAAVDVVAPPPVPVAGLDRRVCVHALDPTRFPVSPRTVDVVHLHSLALTELAVQVCARFGLPLVYTAHTTVERELGHSDWSSVQVELFRRADHVLFPSAHEHDAALRRFPLLARKSRVLANGVLAPAQVEPGARVGPVVFAGRFTLSKGIDVVAGAFDRLRHRPDLELVLAGGHGDEAGERVVAELVRRSDGRHRALGWLTQSLLAELYARAAFVIVPSRYEPFGMVAREAMAAGTPVLVAATGGLRELRARRSGALLLGTHEPEAWAAAIEQLWDSPGRRSLLAARGPRFVAEGSDPDRLAAALVRDVYVPLATRRTAAA